MTEVVLSQNALEQLPRMLDKYKCRHCLIVAGSSSRNVEMLRRWARYLPSSHEVFSPNGTLPQIAEAMRCQRDIGDTFDGIIAIGGGRIIDTAKAISLGHDELGRFFNDPAYKLRAEASKPILAVPTIAGSGSEVTPFAVSYMDGVKHSLSHPALAPVAAIIDPQLMKTVPYLQRAISGVDAVAHGIEALLSNRATETSDVHGMRAIEIGCRVLFHPTMNATENLTELYNASISGGMAIATTRTTIPHAMSYYFTSVHGIPHGHAVGLTMGRYLRQFGTSMQNDKRLWKWSKNYEYVLQQFGAANYVDIEYIWRSRLSELGLNISLSDLKIAGVNMSVLGQHVNTDRFENSPLRMSINEAADLLVN